LTSRSSLLLDGPISSRLQKSSLGFESFYAYVGNREQISHCFGLLHRYLFHSFEIADAISEGVNNLDVLDVRNVITEMLDIITETLIVLLLMVLRVSVVNERS
jgi:hypothetical protein